MAKTSHRFGLLIAVVVIAAIVAAVWFGRRDTSPSTPAPTTSASDKKDEAIAISPDKVDEANDGRMVTVSGPLVVKLPPVDAATGVKADNAVVLLRYVEMLQWREKCASEKSCTYGTVWATYPLDSSRFREPGHENPKMPMTIARFSAPDVRLGAFGVDAYRAASRDRAKPFPVKAADLAPNIAMTFRDADGALYGGNDPAKPTVGDLRVIYRIIPAETVRMTAMQRGGRLLVQKLEPPVP